MACLAPAQRAGLALGREASPDQAAHLAGCRRCRDGVDALRTLAGTLRQAHERFDDGHDEARARLLAALATERPRPSAAPARGIPFPSIGGLTMRQRLTFAGAAAVLLLALGTAWFAIPPSPAYAMDRVADSIRQARSYEYTLTCETALPGDAGKAPAAIAMRGRFSWLAPGSCRIETKVDDARLPQDMVEIMPAAKPGVVIDRRTKTYRRRPARQGQTSPLMLVEKLGSFSGQARRPLGTKEIAGRPAKGFEIEARKIDPDSYPGTVTIWVDAASDLPVLVRYEAETPGAPTTFEMSEFRWNAELDARLFDATPPEGYAEKAPPPSPLDETFRKIARALTLFAKYSGGHYPRVTMLYGDVTRDEFVKLSGAPYPPRKDGDFADERVREVYQATEGFAHINSLLRENPDAAYRGKTVGPADKDKVLLRWKLDDGSYAVVYGDLRSETVAPARLRALEGN